MTATLSPTSLPLSTSSGKMIQNYLIYKSELVRVMIDKNKNCKIR